jgi:hypothetical protein
MILRHKEELPTALCEALDGEFPIDHSNDDAPIPRRQRTIDNQDIAGVNTGFPHGLPSDPDKEGRCGMLDEMLIEVQGAIEVIISRGRIARGDRDQADQTCVSGRDIRRSHEVHVHRSLPSKPVGVLDPGVSYCTTV